MPGILEELPPLLPPPPPPGPRRASATGTQPPSGSARARSPAHHDGLGAAAARTAVPAGAAQTLGAPRWCPDGGRGVREPRTGRGQPQPVSPVYCRSPDCSGRTVEPLRLRRARVGRGARPPRATRTQGAARGIGGAAPEGGWVEACRLRSRA